MPPPASKRKFLFLFCSVVGLTSQEYEYYQYAAGTNGNVRALPTQLGLVEATHDFLPAIVITASCKELVIQSNKISTQMYENTHFFRICRASLELRSPCRESQQIWKSRGARSNLGDGSVELQKKRLNTLKALKRAQKCAPPIPDPPRFTYCSACGRQSDESSYNSSWRFG
jgi:hypothetical protein